MMENTFKNLVTSRFSEEVDTSSKVSELLNRYITDSNYIYAFEAVKEGVPCTVRFYYSSRGSSITELSITGGYNIGYSGEGPCTLVKHLEKFGFINSKNRKQFENLIFTSKHYIFCRKDSLHTAIFK